MSGEIVNLRLARKAKARADAASSAAENRARFGRTKSERLAQERDAARLTSIVDGARREQPDGLA